MNSDSLLMLLDIFLFVLFLALLLFLFGVFPALLADLLIRYTSDYRRAVSLCSLQVRLSPWRAFIETVRSSISVRSRGVTLSFL